MTIAPAPAGAATRWVEDLAAGRAVIDVLGDSIMEADAVADPNRRWHQLLRMSLQSEGYGVEVWTGGAIGGSSTEDYLPGAVHAGHIEFTANRPSLIIMDWRINDWWQGTPACTFRDNYTRLLQRVRELTPASTLLLLNTPWVYNAEALAAHPTPEQDYAAVIRDLAAHHGCLYLGLEWFFAGDDYAALYTPDLVHQNDRGEVVLYAAIRSYLLALAGRG